MQRLKILNTHYTTHNVKRFVLEKPEGFEYSPGQSAHISINQPDWEDQIRPMTFTSLQHWDYLEFIIKIYEDHNGVTSQMGKLNIGDELLLHDIFGTIQFKGPGVFIAGGSGITPFISIFRELFSQGILEGNKLILSNKSADDIILPYELFCLLKSNFINVYTRQGVIGFLDRRIDRRMLIRLIGDFSTPFYVCGPKEFTKEICDALISLGADPEYLVI